MSESPPVPPFLAKRGITRVTDNLEGRELVPPPKAIAMFFGKDIVRAIEARRLARQGSKARPRAEEG